MVVAADNRPTDEEAAEAISEFNSAAGNLLRGWPAADPERIVLVYDQLRVKRIELKRDRGWVNIEVEGRLSIGGKGLEGENAATKNCAGNSTARRRVGNYCRLPLALTVPSDVAVRGLAGNSHFSRRTRPLPMT